MKPDASNHNPDPRYLRGLLKQAGLNQTAAAKRLGITDRAMRNYLVEDPTHPRYRSAPYLLQLGLECLASAN
ncbi:MAG: hypothetical protein GAK37_03161 [Pseudomonas sp.]|nr:MAG: hypothetical protein GAK37_03161 [Pseudomonas sp.]